MKRQRWGTTLDELKDRLSPESLSELVRLFGGRVIRIPRRVRESRRERAARVTKRLSAGASYRTVAEEEDLPLRSVTRAAKLAD